MSENKFFTATYQDDSVQISGQWFDAGSFAVHLLNQFYENDTAARLSVFCMGSDFLLANLKSGFLDKELFLKAGWEYQQILMTLPALKPFDLLDLQTEQQRLQALFTEKNANLIQEYLRAMGQNTNTEDALRILGVLPVDDQKLFQTGEKLIQQIQQAEKLYHSIGTDMQFCFDRLRRFVAQEEDAERLDEANLLPVAMKLFGIPELPVSVQYIEASKQISNQPSVGRQMVFDSYKSFILTDFFEGLHCGYYPRQCEVCQKYFLMKSARWQYYCDGWSGKLVRGRRVSCRQYGEYLRQKEYASENPIKDRYSRRCACIRSEKSKGKITEEFANLAKALAEARYYKAIASPDYAMTQYAEDLERDKLYADIKRGCQE